jgi:D-alanyl-lipoteichoic acid acyltransferase DltB (MBOAT superfamily)
MLFSSPDYPVFLIAVFFLYALARWGDPAWSGWGRIAVMVLLGDVVFLVVAKDPAALWDPIGGILLGLAADDAHAWSPGLVVQWVIGGGLLAGAVTAGRTHAAWLASARGQRLIALGVAGVLAALAAVLAIAWRLDAIDRVTAELVAHGHLLVLLVLGAGIGITSSDPHRQLGRVILLFVASSLFYHAWAAAMTGAYRYLLALLLATIVLDYYLAIWIERTETPWRRKALVIVSVCSNLGILAFFKYADFLAQDVLGLDVGRLNLILPAGISFHTFQSLSYTIDVYRRELPATRSVFQFATFVLFFPQLVAGPIVRARDLLPQLAAPPALELHKATTGLYRILVGLFKKIALADALALSIVDRVFEAPERYSSVEVLVGVYGYALQIYLDFSAYSDIAIGSALVLGFSLPENFRTPYRSANLQEFWRRWHISLSTWLRDYLYIALGGSKGAAWRTYLNLILTMLLGGLWHGASWAFIVWGALHGFGLAVTRYFQRATASAPHSAWHLLVLCSGIAIAGATLHRLAVDDAEVWTHVIAIWLYGTPLWAVLTAWLGRERPGVPAPATAYPSIEEALRVRDARGPELLRIAMCLVGAGFLAALQLASSWTWIPLLLVMWGLGLAADLVERGMRDAVDRLLTTARRGLAALLVFHYVCFAWIFFRATSFENAQLILGRLAALETDHANLVPIVTTALAAGFACHFYPDGSFRWLRERFVALPAELQGAVLAAAALVLRELGQTKIVPFIYFQC